MRKRVSWTGIDEIDDKLQTLEKKSGKSVARSAINAGLAVLSRSIKKEAPVGATKRLKKSIGKRFKKNRRKDLMEAKAGINVAKKSARQAPHGHLVTLGTQHRQTNRKGGGESRGKMPVNDFVKRGTENAKPQVMPAMVQKAEQALERELRKLK